MPVSQAQKRATAKYEKENYDKVLTRFPKGTKERILNTGAKSVNSFIIQAVNEKLENNSKGQESKSSTELEELQKELENKQKGLGIVTHEETEEERKKREKLLEIQVIADSKKNIDKNND